VVADGGYLHGALAPGHRNRFEAPIAAHHLLRSHARAVQAYRSLGRHQVGLVVNIEPKYPASVAAQDVAATRRAEAYMNRQYLDPVFHGRYPEELREVFGEAWPEWPQADFELIRQPIDFLGVNYYTRSVVRHDDAVWPLKAAPVRQKQATYTETGWEVFAQGLTDTLAWIKKLYGDIPQYVTENGAAFYDPPAAPTGGIDDPLRTDYYRAHLRAVHAAIRQGVDVRGYFAWSLFDNLEWSLGYAKRFGLVHVNFETLERTPKKSAAFYADVIATHGAALDANA
jgi:beta-glucosidase